MYEIYLTTNLINGKKYIGQHKVSKTYDYYLGSGIILKQAIEKYGRHNFKKEVLATCETQQEANEQERHFISLFNAVESDDFYNLAEGGQDGAGFKVYHDRLKQDPEYAKQQEEKRIAGMKKWQKEHKQEMIKLGKQNIKVAQDWTREHRKEISQRAKNNYNNSGLKKWTDTHPEEVKENRKKGTEALKQWRLEHPEETKNNLALGPKASSRVLSKKVLCIETNETFISTAAAERAYGLTKDSVGKCARGTTKTTKDPTGKYGRLHWKYC